MSTVKPNLAKRLKQKLYEVGEKCHVKNRTADCTFSFSKIKPPGQSLFLDLI